MEFLATYWLIFLILSLLFDLTAAFLMFRGMKKAGSVFDAFAEKGFGGFFGTWFKIQAPAVICGFIGLFNFILFLIGVIVAILNSTGA